MVMATDRFTGVGIGGSKTGVGVAKLECYSVAKLECYSVAKMVLECGKTGVL